MTLLLYSWRSRWLGNKKGLLVVAVVLYQGETRILRAGGRAVNATLTQWLEEGRSQGGNEEASAEDLGTGWLSEHPWIVSFCLCRSGLRATSQTTRTVGTSDVRLNKPPDPQSLSFQRHRQQRIKSGRQQLTGEWFQWELVLRDEYGPCSKKLPGVTPTENNSRNKGNTARVDRERQRWTGREAPKKDIRTGVKCKSKRWKRSKWKKMALYWGKFKERSRALPSNDTKSLKVGCPGKQDPCPFSRLNFSQDFHLQVWALGTYFKVSPAQISRPLSLLMRLYSQLCHSYTEKKVPKELSVI